MLVLISMLGLWITIGFFGFACDIDICSAIVALL